jgi:hypothetical protein
MLYATRSFLTVFTRTTALQCAILIPSHPSLNSFLKEKYGLMRSPSRLSPYQLLNQLVDFYEIQEGGHAIEGDLDFIISNPKLRPFQNGGRSNFRGECKTCTSQRGTMKCCMPIDVQRTNTLLEDHFWERPKNTNMASGWELIFTFYFMETTYEPLHLLRDQMKYGIARDHRYTYKFQLNPFYFTKLLNMAMVRNIEVMFGQTLKHSVQNSVILCSVMSF